MTAASAGSRSEGTGAILEREAELRALAELSGSAAGGRGAALVIEGPAGAGKTRLLAAAEEIAAADGLRPLRARGGRLERGFGLGVARQLFERRLATMPAAEREASLAGAASLAGPLLGLSRPAAPPPGEAADPEFAAIHGLYWLAANLASSGPLLIAVDDAQWADPESLRFLAYLARRAGELPILVAATIREGEPDQPREPLAALRGAGLRLRPRPLSERGGAALIETTLGARPAPEFAAACHRASGGNPFLLTALLASLSARGVRPTTAGAAELGAEPSGVAEAVAERLEALGAPATALAEAVAVLGNDTELHLAAALAELDEAPAAAAADALAAAEILAPARPLEFVHPLVRAAVYERLGEARRALAHARAAELLASAGGESARVAAQLLAAEPGAVGGAAERLSSAARESRRQGSPETAARYLRRALREPLDRDARAVALRELGAIELRRGLPEAIERLREAFELAAPGAPRATAARELSLALVPAGDYAGAIEVLERAARDLGPDDDELSLLIEAEIGTEAMLATARLPAARERALARLGEVDGAATPGQRAVLVTGAILAAAGDARADEVAAAAERALAGGLLADHGPDSHVVYNAPFPLLLADRFGEAGRVLDAALAEARRRGSLLGVARASAFRASLGLRTGALADAESDARASIEAATPIWVVRQMASGWLIEVLVERGELAEAERELEVAGLDGELDDILMHNFPLLSRARLRLARGEPEQAIADLELLERREGAGRARNPSWYGHRALLAEALLRTGARERATEVAELEVELARRWGAPRALGVALRALGMAGAGEHRLKLLAESVATLERGGARLELGRSLVDLGAALRREGRRRDAREPLARGMELAHRCGASPLAERAREELVATGARPRRMVSSGVEALTPSELRVARMASEGMTNREIAQALFVTLRTVEVHLTHSYQKLEISSREQLSGALAG